MRAADVMTKTVVTVAADATAQEAAALTLASRVSALPVLDASGKLVGIVSEGDLMRRSELGTERDRPWWLELITANRTLAAEYVKSHGRKVSEVMSRDVITASPDTAISAIALLLEKHAIKRVPIVDQGKLVGIVARANLLQGLAALKPETQATMTSKDAEIREEILARFMRAPWRPWLLNVTVKDGIADLWGISNSKEEKAAAGVAVENAPGVVKVNNNIIVRPHNWAEASPYLKQGSKET
jgi:CBS domain-containing protein